jgi:hypothetical protein
MGIYAVSGQPRPFPIAVILEISALSLAPSMLATEFKKIGGENRYGNTTCNSQTSKGPRVPAEDLGEVRDWRKVRILRLFADHFRCLTCGHAIWTLE